MRIFGKRFSEYFEFCKPVLILIVVVGIARFVLSLAGVPNSSAKWVSITAVLWLAALYYAIRVHTSGFGSYKQLLPIYFLMSCAAQLVIVPAIILAIITGTDNIYSAPEYAFGQDGKTWFHAGAHIFLGTTAGSLVPWVVGSLVMSLTKKVTGARRTKAAVRA